MKILVSLFFVVIFSVTSVFAGESGCVVKTDSDKYCLKTLDILATVKISIRLGSHFEKQVREEIIGKYVELISKTLSKERDVDVSSDEGFEYLVEFWKQFARCNNLNIEDDKKLLSGFVILKRMAIERGLIEKTPLLNPTSKVVPKSVDIVNEAY